MDGDAFEDGHEVDYFVMRDESLLSCALLISGEFAAEWLQLVHFRGTTEVDW